MDNWNKCSVPMKKTIIHPFSKKKKGKLVTQPLWHNPFTFSSVVHKETWISNTVRVSRILFIWSLLREKVIRFHSVCRVHAYAYAIPPRTKYPHITISTAINTVTCKNIWTLPWIFKLKIRYSIAINVNCSAINLFSVCSIRIAS